MADFTKPSEQTCRPKARTAFLIRALDLVASGVGLLLLAPLLLAISLAVRLSSIGPVFYLAERVGQNGRHFKLFKFRTMVVGADRLGPGLTLDADPRITPVGRFLRRTKLDELPQLINIFRGEMSLVGPRPEDPRYVALFTPEQRQVLAARPGLTSPASLVYRNEETLLSRANWETVYREQILPHKLKLDLDYLKRRSLWSDLWLVLRTIAAVMKSGERITAMQKLRNRHFLLADLVVMLLTPALALSLRLDSLNWGPAHGQALLFYTAVALLVKISIFYGWGVYSRYWRYAGVGDLILVMNAVGCATLLLMLLFAGLQAVLEPAGLAMVRTVPLIDGLLTGFLVVSLRSALRGLNYYHDRYGLVAGRRVLIIGAGQAGNLVVREMRSNPELQMEPVAFVDDDTTKVGTKIQDLPVLGTRHDIARLIDDYQIQRLVVAVPSAPLEQQRAIISLCERTGIATYSLPGIYQLLAGHKSVSHVPLLDINQLLHREPVETDQAEVATLLKDSKVLVTGAGGSIGSELCRQIARCQPAELILLGHGENSIFEIALDLKLSFPQLVTRSTIVDVRDQVRIERVFQRYQPDVVFHAAAHKHVPFMEENAEEALTNNVLGTRHVLQAAERFGVEHFVFISTDKAVNPVNLMGATKRLAELLVIATAQRTGQDFKVVRFGNVLGSRGSVVPIFLRQIAAGGPLTITHPEMRRYFMTIPEAVQLVLQASVLGQGGELFVLDMGRQIRIEQLALDLIRLSGLEPGRDIQITYSGIRRGEKLSEELFLAGEDYQRTRHTQIFTARHQGNVAGEEIDQVVADLLHLCQEICLEPADRQGHLLLTRICHHLKPYELPPSQCRPAVKQERTSSDTLYPRPMSSQA